MVLNSAFVNLLVHQDCVCWIMKCTVFFMFFLHLFFDTNSLKDLKYVRERAWIYVGGFFFACGIPEHSKIKFVITYIKDR